MTNKTKAIFSAGALLALAVSSHATVSFSGTSMVSTAAAGNPLSLSAGQVGIFLNNNDATAWSAFSGAKIGSGLSLFDSATFTPIGTTDAYTFLASNTSSGTTTFSLSGGFTATLAGGVSAGDQFAVMVFNSSTTTTIPGDTYRIFRGTQASLALGGWFIPTDGSAIGYTTNSANFGASVQQIRDTSWIVASGTVVPEPSTYALLAMSGIALGGYVIRRRRRA
ncbi:MAG: PEP-CTERM sorting domain-containing protein [Chthoniobacterales bacterium]